MQSAVEESGRDAPGVLGVHLLVLLMTGECEYEENCESILSEGKFVPKCYLESPVLEIILPSHLP